MIIEKPRLPIENTGEQHLACVVLVDTSGSMKPYEQDLLDAIRILKDEIMNDDVARGRVELCLVAFDDDVREIWPFGPISRMDDPPAISCGGMTHTHEAIAFALSRAEERKKEYKANGMSYYQPWIWLLTDGASNDADNGSFNELLDKQRAGKCSFYGVGIGSNIDQAELGGMHKDGMVLTASPENLRAAFKFLGASVVTMSTSAPGEKPQQAVPEEMRVSFITL